MTKKSFLIKGEIDRIEGNNYVVVLENGEVMSVPIDFKDVLLRRQEFEPGDQVVIRAGFKSMKKDENATKEIKRQVVSLQNSLFE